MYLRHQFEVEDSRAITFLSNNPFGTIVSNTGGNLEGGHIPIEIYEDNPLVLAAHWARNSTQTKGLQDGDRILAIIQGPHGYISPSWYVNGGVPTWNYMAVHFHGSYRQMNEIELLRFLEQQTAKYESNQDKPFLMEHANSDYIAGLLNGVAGFYMRVDKIEANFKLSQNIDSQSRKNVIDQLNLSENPMDHVLAREMEQLQS